MTSQNLPLKFDFRFVKNLYNFFRSPNFGSKKGGVNENIKRLKL